ncbi:MAG TPA: hypothetical protein PKL99_00315 [Syntrophales bacterium]|nr:hypothetical protein [Syntrophales bacterium]
MKRTVMKFLAFSFVLFLSVPALSWALTGGPDSYGYRYYDSHEEGAPAFSWTDIERTSGGIPVQIGTSGDIVVPDIPIGFRFNFYGQYYSSVSVATNGLLSFDPGAVINGQTYQGNGLPDRLDAINSVIAGFWDDLYACGT